MLQNQKDYTNFNVAVELRGIFAQNGLKNWDLGNTYMADRLRKDGSCIESAIVHIYKIKEVKKMSASESYLSVPRTTYP
jgi:hypothetical protein